MAMNHVQAIPVLEGGVPVRSGATLIGGASGPPGGDQDEHCGRVAPEKLRERLEFAE